KQDYAPQLFKYIQLVMATNIHDAQYATCGTPARFWAVWREENMEGLGRILIQAISKREVTKQDQDIASLFHHDRLLQLMKYFIVFANNVKWVARYQQY